MTLARVTRTVTHPVVRHAPPTLVAGGLASLFLLLAGCGSSSAPAGPAGVIAGTPDPGAGTDPGPSPVAPSPRCATVATPDYTGRSLPVGLSPRPGPEALYLPPPARVPQWENTQPWQAAPILVSGASSYRCGEFVYQDWLYDDHGAAGVADPGDPQSSTTYLFSPKAGTLTYPTDAVFAYNAADLVEFRVRPLADATAFRVTLNTLQDAERAAFTLALGASAAAVEWPHAARVRSPAEWFLTVHGGLAELRRAADGQVVTPAPTVVVDAERRQFSVSLPRAAWDPGRGTVRMALGTGLWDKAASRYAQPQPQASATAPGGASRGGAALFNMAFRRQEPTPDFTVFGGRTIADAAALAKAQANWWRERAQADALAAGDVSAFAARVDFGRLRDGTDDESDVPQTGHMNRIMATRYVYGQGAANARACGGVSPRYPCDGVMAGQLQPYSIYIPKAAPPAGGYGLTLLLHALSANYNQYLSSRHATSLGERGTGSIVVTPAGRGPDGYYKDTAEADAFEVWADVARRFPLDPDWVVSSGVSMGGFGTYRLSTRYPDLFARVMPIVAGGREYDGMLPSLRNVPLSLWTGALDELQPVTTTEATVSALTAAGLRLDAYRFNTWDHLSPSTNDFYAPGVEFLGTARVERNPAHVTYVLNTAEDFPRSNVVPRGAYWLSNLALADPATPVGTVDVRSEGFGVADPAVDPVAQTNGVYTGGYLEPAPFTRRLGAWQAPAMAAPRDRLVIRARNISRVTVDARRARVSCQPQTTIDSDVPLAVTFTNCGN